MSSAHHIAVIIFWISFLAVLYTYVIYPLLLRFLSSFKKPNALCFSPEEDLPEVSLIIAAFNEEKVIAEKLESVLKSNYPNGKIEILIGSDNSTDQTNSILKSFEEKRSTHPLFLF